MKMRGGKREEKLTMKGKNDEIIENNINSTIFWQKCHYQGKYRPYSVFLTYLNGTEVGILPLPHLPLSKTAEKDKTNR